MKNKPIPFMSRIFSHYLHSTIYFLHMFPVYNTLSPILTKVCSAHTSIFILCTILHKQIIWRIIPKKVYERLFFSNTSFLHSIKWRNIKFSNKKVFSKTLKEKQGRKRPLDTLKRMIERREREGERDKER